MASALRHERQRRDRLPLAVAARRVGGGSALAACALIALARGAVADEPAAPIHFYSTARPPADYPGPVPDDWTDAFASAGLALASSEPAAPLPDESAPPPEGSRAPDSESSRAPEANGAESEEPRPDRLAAADQLPSTRSSGTDQAAADRPLHETDPIAYAKAAIAACKARYHQIRGYTCTFLKRERINGRLTPLNVMTMKARTKPLSIYFKFRTPNAGREAIYVEGRNRGKAIVHDVGFGKFVAGTLHLDPRGRRAMDGNRHPITEAGIGNLIDKLIAGWDREMNARDSVVTIKPGMLVNKRPCTMIISSHPRRSREFTFHEVRVYIDHEHGLPIRFEAYGWPRRPGEKPPLLEEYTYIDLKLNPGLTNRDFDPSNKAYSFGRF